ncbi:thioesterase II family protein [Streptomyces sp. NPDC017248]|uniref:thioesterase II family protein n=1 Tax=unclassified Streptomyces TaxID=2593676 RepID=UPI0037B2BC74
MTDAVFTAESPWIRRAARPAPALRLICLPHAGAGASAFRTWPALLPPAIEMIVVQLPGREDRSREDPPTRLRALVRACAVALRPFCTGDFAFYGHCAGALLGWEVARELGERHRLWPRRLLAAAQPAPHLPPPARPLHALPDADLAAEVERRGGLPPAVRRNPALLDMLLPLIRSDFTLWETYRYEPRPPLPVPVTTVRGTEDTTVPAAALGSWAEHTTAGHTHHEVDGGHYFVNQPTERTARVLARALLASDTR